MIFSPRLASVAAALAIAGALVFAASTLMPAPVWNGTFWPMWLNVLGPMAFFVSASWAIGLRIVTALTPGQGRDGTDAFALAVGVLVFGLGVGTAGLAGVLGQPFYWGYPALLLMIGAKPLGSRLVQLFSSPRPISLSMTEVVLLVLGVFFILLLLPQVMNPENLNYDTRWYHLRGAERYALAHGQVRTPEGDYLLSLPQLAMWVSTWALLAPLPLDGQLRLAMHLELAAVLATLATIPPLTRALFPDLPRAATRFAWVSFFFFPSIFIYDTGLFGGTDHFAALWAAPMVLAWLQARERSDLHSWVLWGVLTTGALAKYTSLFLVLPLVAIAAIDWVIRLARPAGSVTPKSGPLVAALTTVVLAAPYWARNLWWYHDPVYPMAARFFGAKPFGPDAEVLLARLSVPTSFINGGLPMRVDEGTVAGTVTALGDYWRQLNTWGDFTGGQPAFGFMMMVGVVALLLFKRSARAWLIVLLIHAGIAIWFNLKHEMRYLTIFVPVMAAFISAVAVRLWHSGRLELRTMVVAAVLVQSQVYGDLPFRKTHRMNGNRSPFEAGLDFLRGGQVSGGTVATWAPVNAALPPDALPLIHGSLIGLGLERQSVTDVPGLQFGINAGRAGSEQGFNEQLRALGVTHLVWSFDTEQFDSISGEALFRGLAARTTDQGSFGPLMVGKLPPELHRTEGELILYYGCNDTYPTGLYTVADLAVPMPHWPAKFADLRPRREAADWRALVPDATYVVMDSACEVEFRDAAFALAGIQRAPKRRWLHFTRH